MLLLMKKIKSIISIISSISTKLGFPRKKQSRNALDLFKIFGSCWAKNLTYQLKGDFLNMIFLDIFANAMIYHNTCERLLTKWSNYVKFYFCWTYFAYEDI